MGEVEPEDELRFEPLLRGRAAVFSLPGSVWSRSEKDSSLLSSLSGSVCMRLERVVSRGCIDSRRRAKESLASAMGRFGREPERRGCGCGVGSARGVKVGMWCWWWVTKLWRKRLGGEHQACGAPAS